LMRLAQAVGGDAGELVEDPEFHFELYAI
jgi:hypothetical protein